MSGAIKLPNITLDDPVAIAYIEQEVARGRSRKAVVQEALRWAKERSAAPLYGPSDPTPSSAPAATPHFDSSGW